MGSRVRLRGELHVHSTFSDGRDSPDQIILEAINRELDFISITDHDTFKGSLKAARAVNSMNLDIVVIIGAEIRSDEGDLLIYCPETPIDRFPSSALELADYAREHDCIAIPAHPFDIHRKGIGDLVYSYRWDAIEVFNAFSDMFSNRKAQQAAKEMNIPGIAGSDAHVLETIGSALTLVEVNELSAEEIIKSIKKGDVKPLPGRPGPLGVTSTVVWSIKKRFRKKEVLEYESYSYDFYGKI